MDSCPTLPMEDRVTSIMKKFDALHQKLNETKRDYQKELECMKQVHQHELNKVRAELNMVKKQLPVPPFQCTMYNIQNHLSTQNRWASLPFYSHYGGYKMRFDVFVTQTSIGFHSSKVMKYTVFVTHAEFDGQPVSYTHLTLPTIYSV